jgi:putative ABC transport system permease protein
MNLSGSTAYVGDMEVLLQDLRFAARVLGRSKGVTVAAVLCIGLGIGINACVFSIVEAVLLRPYPFAHPESLVAVHLVQPRQHVDSGGLSYLDVRDLREQNVVFSQLAAHVPRSLTLSSGGEEPERVVGEAVSSELLPLLGVRPLLGRVFRADEDRPGASHVVVLSYDLWRRRFHGDPAAIGRPLQINDDAYTVIGVMPKGFLFPWAQVAWIPIAPIEHNDLRTDRRLAVLARLKPGISLVRARADVSAVAERLAALYPDSNASWGAVIWSLRDEMIGVQSRQVVLTLMGAVFFLLLIACANVANLLLARATGRQREIAVRAAFGAPRRRIVRQLLTESLLIALAGGALGIALALAGIRLCTVAIPPQRLTPYFVELSLDGRVLLFTLVVSLGTGLLFGLAPAMSGTAGGRLWDVLREGGRAADGSGSGGAGGRRGVRLRSALVVVEIALSLVLLVAAALFARSFLAIHATSGGFDAAHVLGLRFYLPGPRYGDDGAKLRRLLDVVRRVESLPEVVAAGASYTLPLAYGGLEGPVTIEGRARPRGQEPRVFYTGVTPGYFAALGVALERGRAWTGAECERNAPLALVNQSFAHRFWPAADPLGRRFRLLDVASPRWITVIGVVPDIKNGSLDAANQPSAYLPYRYQPIRNVALLVRTRSAPAGLAPAVRREIHAADAALPIYDLAPMESYRQQNFWAYSMFGGVFGIFGAVALALAAVGVYSVFAYSVAQRRHEIGVRMAIGAQNGHVLRLVLGDGLRLAGAGVAAGALGALALTPLVGSVLYAVSPTDPVSFSLIALVLAVTALLASFLPARRALASDPLAALRGD